jgi:two-component system chemotaxis response regulator CheY
MMRLSVNNSTRMRVLIVDDNEMTRGVLRMTIQGDHFDIIGEAGNGRAGVELAIRLRPDIVCLDVVMPDMNGLEVLRLIRDALPAVTVLMVTASSDAETVQTAIKGGAAGFILKPFTTGVVRDTMDKAAAKVRVQRTASAT